MHSPEGNLAVIQTASALIDLGRYDEAIERLLPVASHEVRVIMWRTA